LGSGACLISTDKGEKAMFLKTAKRMIKKALNSFGECKVFDDLKVNGILAVAVPDSELLAGGGHINCFTPGHLVYHLAEAGFDLTDMSLKRYGYLGIICHKSSEVNPFREHRMAVNLVDHISKLPIYINEDVMMYKKEHHNNNIYGEIIEHERIPLKTFKIESKKESTLMMLRERIKGYNNLENNQS
jgi:hypothetical protein